MKYFIEFKKSHGHFGYAEYASLMYIQEILSNNLDKMETAVSISIFAEVDSHGSFRNNRDSLRTLIKFLDGLEPIKGIYERDEKLAPDPTYLVKKAIINEVGYLFYKDGEGAVQVVLNDGDSEAVEVSEEFLSASFLPCCISRDISTGGTHVDETEFLEYISGIRENARDARKLSKLKKLAQETLEEDKFLFIYGVNNEFLVVDSIEQVEGKHIDWKHFPINKGDTVYGRIISVDSDSEYDYHWSWEVWEYSITPFESRVIHSPSPEEEEWDNGCGICHECGRSLNDVTELCCSGMG